MSRISCARRARRLLASSSAVVAIATAAPCAHAQSSSVTGSGDLIVSNGQTSSQMMLATANGAAAQIAVTGPTDAATIAIADNTLAVAARANTASLLLAPHTIVLLSRRSTMLTADDASVSGTANLLIANSQELRAGGSAQANQLGSPFRISLGSVGASAVSLDANRSDVLARGNAVVSTIDMSRSTNGGGAGIVSSQVSRTNSSTADEIHGIGARVRSGALLESGAVTGSRISVSNILGNADAASNAADNSLSALIAPSEVAAPGPVMLSVPITDGRSTSARFAILNRQAASDVVKARSGYLVDIYPDDGPGVRAAIDGDVDASTIGSDGNSFDASGKGNLSSNRLSLSGNIGAVGNEAIGAIANTQMLSDARIVGTTHGGVGIGIAGALTGSAVSATDNAFTVSAAGNVATDNRLSVSASIADGAGRASALSGHSTATFTLDNWQDSGATGISSATIGSAPRITIAGAIDASAIDASGNSAVARSTGDSASNAMAIDATGFGGSAALANRQSGRGMVAATIGSDAIAPGGVTIVADGPARDSRLSVTDNSMLGAATGNVAANALDVSGTDLFGGVSGFAGSQGDDYGAVGTLALLNDQTIGDPGIVSGTPAITSSIVTRSGVITTAPAIDSVVAVSRNEQRAAATANAASNRLTAAAATSDGASLALSSTQFGQGFVGANSDVTLSAPGQLVGSAVSITDNSNLATATINDVENEVALTVARSNGEGAASASAGTLGAASATGMTVLDNQQFSTGSASAVAVSRIGDSTPAAIERSRVSLAGNTVVADSLGNRALNDLAANVASGSGGAALASGQTNMARIDASATITGLGFGAPALADSSLSTSENGSSAVARGNAADNRLTVNAAAGGSASVAGGYDRTLAMGDAALANAQGNYGAVSANSGGFVALNAGTIAGSNLTIADTTIAASAYGNIASNAVNLGAPASYGGVSLSNIQANYGPVSATVDGAGYQSLVGPMTAGTIGIAGNRLSATATGNQASSAIATPR